MNPKVTSRRAGVKGHLPVSEHAYATSHDQVREGKLRADS